MCDFGFRHYNQSFGRFMSEDPVCSGPNLYITATTIQSTTSTLTACSSRRSLTSGAYTGTLRRYRGRRIDRWLLSNENSYEQIPRLEGNSVNPGNETSPSQVMRPRPSHFRRRFLEDELRKGLLDIVNRCVRLGIDPDFTEASLERLDAILPRDNQDYRESVAHFTQFEYDGSPLSDWLVALGPSSYFGEVLVKNLGGKWRYPSRLVVFYSYYTGYLSPVFRHWFVLVGKQRIPVFEIVRRRMIIGQEESLVKAYHDIASGRFKLKEICRSYIRPAP